MKTPYFDAYEKRKKRDKHWKNLQVSINEIMNNKGYLQPNTMIVHPDVYQTFIRYAPVRPLEYIEVNCIVDRNGFGVR